MQAEKAAWEVAQKHSLDLVAINPAMLIGPVTGSRSGGSVDSVKVGPVACL